MADHDNFEADRMQRHMAAVAGRSASIEGRALSSYELGFVEALLHRDGVRWGDATAGQFEAALRELDSFVRMERGDLRPN